MTAPLQEGYITVVSHESTSKALKIGLRTVTEDINALTSP